MSTRKVGFAIIGAGMIAEFHAQAIEAIEGARLIGVYDDVEERKADFAGRHGITPYKTLDQMLADQTVDAVTIATPTGLHAAHAIAAAEAGKHVMCEKPMDVTPEKAQTIIDACHNAGTILAPVFQYRYGAGARLIREAIDAGRFGKILFSSARIKWFRPQSYYDQAAWRGTWAMDGGGCLMNQSIHAIDLMLYFGGVPAEVYGIWATRTHDIEVEDNAAATVRFANGAMGTIESSTSCSPGFPFEITVSGSRGTAVLSGENITLWAFEDTHPLDERVAAISSKMGEGAADPKAISIEGHREVLTNLVRAVNGDTSGLIDPVEARYPIDVICGIYQSQKNGMPVTLPWTPNA